MKWAREMFPPEQVRAWLRTGLQTSDLGLIVELRAPGVPPELMTLTVRRQSMLDRIRHHGYTAGRIARTLQLEGCCLRAPRDVSLSDISIRH
jgi:hypothetical protein